MSYITIEPTNVNKKKYVKPETRIINKPQNTPQDNKALDNTLKGLALLGLLTLNSCVSEEFDPMAPKGKTGTELVDNKLNNDTTSVGVCNNILQTLGVFSDKNSIEKVSTINYMDEQNTRHWIKPVSFDNNFIQGYGVSVDKEGKTLNPYAFAIAKTEGNSMTFIKKDSNNNVEILDYVLNDDNSVSEYVDLNNGYMAEQSVYKKINKAVERTFPNGEKEVLNNFSLNEDFPSFGINIVIDTTMNEINYDIVVPLH